MTALGWYARRLSKMSPAEMLGRARAAVLIHHWRCLLDKPLPMEHYWLSPRRFTLVLPEHATHPVPAEARARLIATAEHLMDGRTEFFGVARDDMICPDWFFDPQTGRSAPAQRYAFDIRYRDEQVVGNIKQLWELSRHHHLTVLAAAFAVTRDDRYACRVAEHLKSWWAANPPLRGVHWVSGIELGIRLISWVWVRRLIEGWPGAPDLFEDNPEALHQIYHHQRWLSTFPSIGSSANNHAVAEAAGQLTAACAFPWFRQSQQWRRSALRRLDAQLRSNTFGSGVNRELATDYHGLVLELGLLAAIEAEASGHRMPESTWLVLLRMSDALAAMVDVTLRPPRQGDGDDGLGLLVDGEPTNRWASLLATSGMLFGRMPWWPDSGDGDVRTALLTSLAGPRPAVRGRPEQRPYHFADAGLTIVRSAGESGEIWCRCDGGPHGFGSIAAHAHADALSLEVRHGGVDVLADPGTYCYHGEAAWRSYFRSTLGHNTLELDGQDQSGTGGAFLWMRHARSCVLVSHHREGGVWRWCGEHHGYSRRARPAIHRRSVELDATQRELRIVDEVLSSARHTCRLAFHLGPRVLADLAGHGARLSWRAGEREHTATLQLPSELSWAAYRGQPNPPLGWYSPSFGRREPTWTLLGSGVTGGDTPPVSTVLRFGS